jgi:hypothetical protein
LLWNFGRKRLASSRRRCTRRAAVKSSGWWWSPPWPHVYAARRNCLFQIV